jgi:hypothetical protein
MALTESPLLTRPASSNGDTARRTLRLLERRARLTAGFISFARSHPAPAGTEPKLALALAGYARTHPVFVTNTSAQVIDLGTRQSAGQRAAPDNSGTEGLQCGPDCPPRTRHPATLPRHGTPASAST